jgi:arylsulfatase A-like enzyme/Flp pilus assembly protein TadD
MNADRIRALKRGTAAPQQCGRASGEVRPRHVSASGVSFASFAFFAVIFFTFCLLARADNVILITVDTLRADHLEAYGYTKGKTPTIAALAKEGVTFENVIVQTPITLPSHATILTGAYPIYHGVQDVVGRLRDDVPTLAEWFKQKGYATGAFVGSSVLAAAFGLNRGFETYNDRFHTQGLRQIDFDRLERRADDVIEPALQWLQKNRSRPFFLWVHLYDPHDPYAPPEPFATEFKEHPYDGEIAYVDSALAEFFQSLKEQKLYENSLIVFTSDHGESLGEHREVYHGYFIYDASLRVPLIFKLSADQAKGQSWKHARVPNQVRSVDIAPTIIQLLGEKVPSWMQGEALLAVMTGKRPKVDLPAYTETHYPRIHFGWSPLFGYSTANYKFIEAPIPELYDLQKDPHELKNIFTENKALASRMKEDLHAVQRRFGAQPGRSGKAAESDPEMMERLKSLGYVAFSAGNPGTTAQQLHDPKEKISTYNQLNRAIAVSRRGQVRVAIDMLQQVAQQEPKMPVVHFLLGSEYFTLGQYLKAAEEFAETLQYNPQSNVARFQLARAYSQSGLTDKAEQTLREILSQEPRHFAARHLLATLLGKRGRFEEAVSEELKALEGRPDYADGFNNLGSYYFQLGKIDRAADSYRKAVESAPNNPMARTNLSLAYLKQARYDQALEQARAAVQLDPQSSLAHFYLGQAYVGKGMKEEARAAFRKAKELNPNLNVPQL